LATAAQGFGDQRIRVELAGVYRLRLSPIRSYPTLLGQDKERESGHRSCGSSLALPALVSPSIANVNRFPSDSISTSSLVTLANARATPTNQVKEIPASRMEIVKRRFENKVFSKETVDILMESVRESTSASYESAWKNWVNWNNKKGSDPLSSSLIIILQFLTDIANSGSSYSSVNTSRSMLSSTLDPIDGYKIGEHPTVVQLLKGCFNRKPPKARYNSLWDPDVVLNYLNSLPNNSDLGVAVLSKKLATLLALATIYRVSEIMAISFHSLKFSPTAASFSLTRPKKAQHSGPLKSFVLPRFKGKCCPVECLESYVAISGEWRDPDSSALFLAIRRPHKPVGSSTLGNWIKSCLSDAGLDPSSFSAHSTRGAAASKAVKQGIPVDTVLKTANWSRESTFQKFYHYELVVTTVTEAVLTQISSE
jgi:hypothetical protein